MRDNFDPNKSKQKILSKDAVPQCQTNQIKQKSDAQVGTWVIPKSGIGTGAYDHREGHRPIDLAPKASPRKRPSPLSVRMSDAQRAVIKEKAAKGGLSVNQYMLMQACGAELVQRRLSAEDRAERAGALRAYRGTGTLLNQIAKHLNGGRMAMAVDIVGAIKRHEKNAAAVLAALIKGLPL